MIKVKKFTAKPSVKKFNKNCLNRIKKLSLRLARQKRIRIRIKNKFFLHKKARNVSEVRSRKLVLFGSKRSVFFSKRTSFLRLVNRRFLRRIIIQRTYFRYFLFLNRKSKLTKYRIFLQLNNFFRARKSKSVSNRRFKHKRNFRYLLNMRHLSHCVRLAQPLTIKLKKFKKIRKTFLPKKPYYNFSKNPFQNLEKISFYKLFGYIKPKRRNNRRKGAKKFWVSRKRYGGKYSIKSYKKYSAVRWGKKAQPKKKPKNLVFKNKMWCVQIKKSDGRLIYRPLKLSDFLSSRSGWRTRTTSVKKRIPKSARASLFIRFMLRSRNEYDAFTLKKRKMYNYYKKIYKYMGWKFGCYRSLFKKYSLSYQKYTSFQNIANQFAWTNLASRVIQAKASNLNDLFRNSARYSIFSNSPLLWQLVQTTFINGAFPSSFYTSYYSEKNIGNHFQKRSTLYNWNKKYRMVYNKSTILSQQFKKPLGAYAAPSLIFKSSAMFSSFNSRFSSLLTNKQRHFIR